MLRCRSFLRAIFAGSDVAEALNLLEVRPAFGEDVQALLLRVLPQSNVDALRCHLVS